MSGLSSEGFWRKRLVEIKTEIENELKAQLGASINLVAPSVFSTLVGIFAERESSLWELAEDVYNSQYPDTAEGVSLDNVAAITGITRREATFSTVRNVHLFGTVGTNVPAGTVLSVDGNEDARFVTDNAVTLVAGQDEIQNLSFSAIPASGTFQLQYEDETTEAIGFSPAASAIEVALNNLNDLSGIEVSGNVAVGFNIIFGGNDGEIDQPLLIVANNTLKDGLSVDVDITIAQTQAGIPQGTVNCTAETAGATQAVARTLTEIDTPVSGLNRVINLEDAIVGRDRETDLELRERRAISLQIAGAGTVEAIRSSLLNVDGVTDAFVFENDTDVTDSDGRPPKSFESVVAGGDTQEIADKIWEVKPAGIATFGSRSDIVTDSQGNSQTIFWSRPTQIEIYLEVDLTVGPSFPAGGADDIKAALIARGNQFGIGGDVIVVPSLVAVLDDFAGVLDATFRIGTSPTPSGDANIDIAADEISIFDSARTTVVVI